MSRTIEPGVKALVFIPTYNERDNLEKIYEKLKRLPFAKDFLFLDDGSPDGTGHIAEAIAAKDPSVHTLHRSGKQGIGSAHKTGIAWAYERGYETLVTMDCDFTHQPEDVPRFLAHATDADVVVGSRYMDSKSLSDWNYFRKFLTNLGHFLTVHLLKMPYDASGAFRLYRLNKIPARIFSMAESSSYSFFFESLHLLSLNDFVIREVSIVLPKRTYGHSKMRFRDAYKSFELLVRTYLRMFMHPERFYLEPKTRRSS